jgi:hypothetical protein
LCEWEKNKGDFPVFIDDKRGIFGFIFGSGGIAEEVAAAHAFYGGIRVHWHLLAALSSGCLPCSSRWQTGGKSWGLDV